MFAKHLVVGCLLLSGIAQVCAMEPGIDSADNTAAVQVDTMDPEVTTPAAVDDAEMAISTMATEPLVSEDAAVSGDVADMNFEQPASMKKRPASIAEDMNVNEVSTPVEMTTTEMSMEDVQPNVIEDKNDNQEHADVQGVFESMSREEEGESFPG